MYVVCCNNDGWLSSEAPGECGAKSSPSPSLCLSSPGHAPVGSREGGSNLNRVVFDCDIILEHVGSGTPHTADLRIAMMDVFQWNCARVSVEKENHPPEPPFRECIVS